MGLLNSSPIGTPAAPSVIDAYNQTLGRNPDASGSTYWSNIASQPGMTQATLNAQLAAAALGEGNTSDALAANSFAKSPANISTTWNNADQAALNGSSATNTNGLSFDNSAGKWVTPPPVAAQTPAVATYAPTSATAATYTLNPATDTTGGQVSSIIDQNSPLMQQARTQGLQQANARGLLDSSIAVGDAQNAVLNAATPIGTSNAAAYLQTGLTNTSNQQQTNLTNANAANTANQFNANATNANNQFNAAAQNTIKNLNLSLQNQVALQNLTSGNAQLIQSNAELGNMYNQTMSNLSNIQNSTTMDAAAKQTAINNQLALLQQGLAASNNIATTSPSNISSLNLSQYFR